MSSVNNSTKEFEQQELNGDELQPSFNRVMRLIDYELCFKHPLNNIWTLWHWENDRSKSWSDCLCEITSFNTVEDFFSVYYFIKPPSDLKPMNDYMVFKQGIRPMWEDENNQQGGRWVILLDKIPNNTDLMWQDLLLSVIGETFERSHDVCGVVINIRNKSNKLSLWTRDASDEQAVLSIGNSVKQRLSIGDVKIQYQVHKDAMEKTGPFMCTKYVL